MRNSIQDIEIDSSRRRDEPGPLHRVLSDDELLEVTPASLRMRKRILDKRERGRQVKRAKRQRLDWSGQGETIIADEHIRPAYHCNWLDTT